MIEFDRDREKVRIDGIRTADLPRHNPMRWPPDHGAPLIENPIKNIISSYHLLIYLFGREKQR